ncbi:DNA-binding transcriptional regulator, LysR family [Marinactinospora thermotolerans DSM 45154]|uniref:DNA-binding transcriptional regulator, LysR family n=1 Tax=Marinactinospora thermotolerans DSM 45154 TaxID=1122192 RepID=A0A1T4K136_9ACTN|nr:LysR family transcriptional regulator [Marinactinospora thermotolerans]SJZ36196.1 DNA-binding transcriptional regulator, LysR family [Marinactinospora thermotolerans DSM 45154]
MDARQLAYFLAIVDEGGFNRAARALHLAQPSLSQAVRALERDLGTPLFHRVGRRVVLTEAGHAMVEPAREVLRGLAATRAVVESVRRLRSGRVEVVSMPSPAVAPLSSAVAAFARRHPGVEVVLRAADLPGEVVEAVRTGAAELGLLGDDGPPGDPGLAVHELGAQEFVLVVPATHPLAGRGRVRPADLAGLSVVAGPPGSRMRALVDGYRDAGVEVRISVEAHHREAIIPLVVEGAGVALLAEAWARPARMAGLAVVGLDPPAHLGIWLVTRRGRLSPGAAAFRGVLLGDAEDR